MIRILERATRPHPSVRSPSEWHRFRLLSSLLLGFVIVIVLMLAYLELFPVLRSSNWNPRVEAITRVGLAGLAIAWFLTRTRFYRWAPYLSAIVFELGVFLVSIHGPDPTQLASTLNYLGVNTLIFGMTASGWEVASLAVGHAFVILGVQAAIPGFSPPVAFGTIVFNASVAVLTALYAALRSRYETTVAEQGEGLLQAARLSSVGEMSASLLHEINNPLAILSAFVEELRHRARAPSLSGAEVDELAARMERSVARISSTVQTMRLLAGRVDSDLERVEIRGLVSQTVEFCRNRFTRIGARVECLMPGEPVETKIRPGQVSQVLVNLLNNAADAVEGLPERWVRVRVAKEGTDLVITVTDSGKGVPEEIRERIFAPFFTTKNYKRGTGLGLSISRTFVESHSGKITVDTEEGHTRFTIRLPLGEPAGAPP